MNKAIVIYNPISGKGLGQRAADAIKTSKLNELFQLKICQTEFSGHAKEIALKGLEEGVRYFIAVGGDGTINEVGSVLKGKDAALGIIPMGSGNGLAKHIGMSTDYYQAILQLCNAKENSIDTLTINNRFAVNVSGFGFDGYVAYRFNHHGKRGLSTYTKIGLTEYFKYPLQDFEISFDSQKKQVKKHMLVIANASQFGNAAIIAPTADLTDGIIEIVAVELPPVLNIPGILYRLFTGKLKDNKYIQTYKCKSFIARSNRPVHLHIDGESIEPINEIIVSIEPKSLSILTPSNDK
jgi:YegS/Rv2252/BmrU family lipid kinase